MAVRCFLQVTTLPNSKRVHSLDPAPSRDCCLVTCPPPLCTQPFIAAPTRLCWRETSSLGRRAIVDSLLRWPTPCLQGGMVGAEGIGRKVIRTAAVPVRPAKNTHLTPLARVSVTIIHHARPDPRLGVVGSMRSTVPAPTSDPSPLLRQRHRTPVFCPYLVMNMFTWTPTRPSCSSSLST